MEAVAFSNEEIDVFFYGLLGTFSWLGSRSMAIFLSTNSSDGKVVC